MMNLKETISFKTLREKGASAVEVSNDEVVQIVSKSSEIKVLITQEYFLKLLTAYNSLLVSSGEKKEKVVSKEEMATYFSSLENRINLIASKVNE